jgi:putative glutamine amidotransferase
VGGPRIGITTFRGRDASDRPTVGVGQAYVDAVHGAGGFPVLLPILDPAAAPDALAGLDGLLLSGGGDVEPTRYGQEPAPEVYGVDAARDAWELGLLGAAPASMPVLAICRGMQVLNVARGGTLIQHVGGHAERDRRHEVVHDVEIVPGTRLALVSGAQAMGVNTLHHQAVAALGAGLCVAALAPDGTVEAVEADDGTPVLAVQWHPELLQDRPRQRVLFRWLVDAAASQVAVAARC